MAIDFKYTKNIVERKITANGFNLNDIELHTELLISGYLDSLDIVEILQELEALSGVPPNWKTEDKEEIICINWFFKIANI